MTMTTPTTPSKAPASSISAPLDVTAAADHIIRRPPATSTTNIGAKNDDDGALVTNSNNTADTSTAAAAPSPDVAKKKKGSSSVRRHAEKRRTSTCLFANRVARLSIEHYKRHVPQSFQATQKQTCLATLVVHEAETNRLHVVAMGVGTKFLTERVLQQELLSQEQQQQQQQANSHRHRVAYGSRVRDCHAEVLCRRAFRRYLTELILSKRQQDGRQPKGGGCTEHQLPWIIQLLENSIPHDDSRDHKSVGTSWKLTAGMTLHAYCSSAPCGNAVLKKFAKMKKEVFRQDLANDEWRSRHDVHEPIMGHNIRMGEFALLLKKDRSRRPMASGSSSQDQAEENVRSDAYCPTTTTASTLAPAAAADPSSSWPARQSTNWCPPGTTTVWAAAAAEASSSNNDQEESGSLHTCSDKLCRWNCLGWQGSLLSSCIPVPLHVETLTVGRKLSSICCRRAVCCRVEPQEEEQSKDVKQEAAAGDDKRRRNQPKKKKKHTASFLTLPYKVHHPTILGTDEYMDESGMIEMSLQSREKGQDVRFHSSSCWVWWPGLDKAEAINGTTGHAGSVSEVDDRRQCNLSKVSTASLVELFLKARHDDEDKIKEEYPTTLSDLRELKQRVAPAYENAKSLLLTKHPVLRQWKRRAPNTNFFRRRDEVDKDNLCC